MLCCSRCECVRRLAFVSDVRCVLDGLTHTCTHAPVHDLPLGGWTRVQLTFWLEWWSLHGKCVCFFNHYSYLSVFVCVCVCVFVRERERWIWLDKWGRGLSVSSRLGEVRSLILSCGQSVSAE